MKQSHDTMDLGTFSISLAVKNLEASRSFYKKLGFQVFAGDTSQNWLILKNGDHAIGLFQVFGVSSTLHFDFGGGVFDLAKIVRRGSDFSGADGFFEALQFGSAWDW